LSRHISVAVATLVTLTILLPSLSRAQDSPTCGSLEVLILLDESGSIDNSDPENRRIGAAKQYLDDLERNEDVDISVALAGFATAFRNYSQGFLPLDTNADRLDRLIEEFASRHDGYLWHEDAYRWHTDYIEAFRGILEMPWSADCRRTVWFTDGRHDLDLGAPRVALGVRPYDALRRDIDTRANLVAVEGLMTPTICGEDALRSEIASGYFGLADRITEAQVDAFEIRLFYLKGDQPYGETLELFEKLKRKQCGSLAFEHRPVDDIETLTDDWLFDASCASLPGVPLTTSSGGGVIWDGALPNGILPETVESVEILVAGGGAANLETDHATATVDKANPALTRMTLHFDRANRLDAPLVTGGSIKHMCGSVTYLRPDLVAEAHTSTALAGQPLEFSVRVGSHQSALRPLTSIERGNLLVSRDGEDLNFVWTADGHLRDPSAPRPGAHEYRFALRYDAPIGTIATAATVEVHGLVLQAMPVTSRILAGQPLEFSVRVGSHQSALRPLTSIERGDLVVFRDGVQLDFVWGGDGVIQDPAAPPPGRYEYRFELRDGHPDGWVAASLHVQTESLPLSMELLTSPAFAGRSIDFGVLVDSRALSVAERDNLVVFRDGVQLDFVWGGDGVIQDPAAPPSGGHEYRFELRDGHPDGWVAESFRLESVPLPPGPVMELDRSRLGPLAGRVLTVPVQIDRSSGCIELDPSVTVEAGDGALIAGTATFPDDTSNWCSDSNVPRPGEVTVRLDSQTNTEQGMTVDYTSISPQSERQTVSMAVPGPIDRERNQALEGLIVGLFLVALCGLLWSSLYGVNRYIGRLARLRRIRYAEFTVTRDSSLLSDIGESDHRSPRRVSAGRIEAGRMHIVRKTPFWRVWRTPYTELSLADSPSTGFVEDTEMLVSRRHKIHKQQLSEPIVLVESGDGRGRRGVVMARIPRSTPVGRRMTEHVRDALARIGES